VQQQPWHVATISGGWVFLLLLLLLLVLLLLL